MQPNSPPDPRTLWLAIQKELEVTGTDWDWRADVARSGQTAAFWARSWGAFWSDENVFKALILAVLTSNTAWYTVDSKWHRLEPMILEWFRGFDLAWYASASDQDVSQLVARFESERTGSRSLAPNLRRLVWASRSLLRRRQEHGTLDAYFAALVRQSGAPKHAARWIAGPGPHQLPAFGIALAAEALKNLGYDVAKPDAHILRAVGSFGAVRFRNWKDRSDFRSPSANDDEKLLAMSYVEDIARATGIAAVLVDNAIWLLCAESRSGLHFSNRELARLAAGC